MTSTNPLPRAFSEVFQQDEKINVYSYIRFSTKAQKLGFSEKRQIDQLNRFFEQYPQAVQVERYEDLGVSAFKGKNLKTGQLAKFVERMKAKEIFPNSLLLVESFDRISRMGGYDALELIISIIQADCAIYTLFDNRLYSRRKKDSGVDITLIQNILERASDESRSKSDRVTDAKARNLLRAEQGEIIAKRAPFWISYENGQFVLNEHAKAVRRATELCFDMGCLAIAKVLNAENHPKSYSVGIITKLLRQNALYGSYIATDLDKLGRRTLIKKEIKDYYPSVISEAEFHRIGAKLEQRQMPALAGRHAAEFRNILRGIVFCACGATLRTHSAKKSERQYHDLLCTASEHGKCTYSLTGKGLRYRYARIEEIFLAYQSQIPFHKIIAKGNDIKALEKEHEETTGLIIQQEKALSNAFAILQNASEIAQKYVLSNIEEVSHALDKLKEKERVIGLEIASLQIASKSAINVMEIYQLLLNEHGRMRVNNFLQGQGVKLVITPIQKKHYYMDIFVLGSHIDRVHVTPDGYTAGNKSIA
ncbi:recombinase family protein [Pseudomonas fulva]|uniref:recombinase family protein n=1 Tax=Pseudomonas fulva TaxID=47880 RepID=UPI0018AB8EB7|nr:recombinase family protein [Pseudomonas fulva]QPH44287.1 recombinase family protein [Pseudomonas fulva]